MRQSQKRQNQDNLNTLQWENTPDFEKKQLKQTEQNKLDEMRQYHFDKTSDVNKDFMFLKIKSGFILI